MRKTGLFVATLLGLALLMPSARADAPEGWHKSLADGVEAAGKSGKPILLITAWNRKL